MSIILRAVYPETIVIKSNGIIPFSLVISILNCSYNVWLFSSPTPSQDNCYQQVSF